MTEPRIEGVTGVILAGGKSSRFGANKALALLHGKHLIEHPAGILQTIFPKLLLVTNTQEEYEFLHWPMTKDRYPGAGPLAGIHAALKSAVTDHIFVTACDMPLLQPGIIRYLCEQRENRDAVLPWTANGPEPLCAVYSQTALPSIMTALESRANRVQDVLNNLNIRKVDEKEMSSLQTDKKIFTNINRQDDLSCLNR